MNLTRWIPVIAFAGAISCPPLFAQQAQEMDQNGGMSSGAQAEPWSDQQASLDAVKKLQQALKDKGHDAGPVDGLIGPRTQSALRNFQQEEGLDATGEIDSQTLTALGIDSAEFAAFGIKDESTGQPGRDTMDPGVSQEPAPNSGMR